MRSIAASLILVALGTFVVVQANESAGPATQPASAPSLSFELTPGPHGYLSASLKFTNPTDQPIILMKPIDGSDVGWRQVTYSLSVTGPDGKPLQQRGLGRCGNVNPLRVDDFVTVAPRESVSIAQGFLAPLNIVYDLSKPGTYKVKLTYAFALKDGPGGVPLGKDEEGTEALLKRAWVGTIVSDEVAYEVKEGEVKEGEVKEGVAPAKN